MPIESMGWEPNPDADRPNLEDPFGRDVEARGNTGIEDRPERENQFWLAGFLNRESIERAKRYPLYEEASTEWIVYSRLLAISVETGPELSPHVRTRLSNLIGVLRVVMYPNLKPEEQDSLHQLAGATAVDMQSLQFQIDDEARDDLQWIWETFDLEIPESDSSRLFLNRD